VPTRNTALLCPIPSYNFFHWSIAILESMSSNPNGKEKETMNRKVAIITGITGQDGSYLAELLLDKGYEVHGIVRRVALEDPHHHLWRIRHVLDKIKIHSASLESFASLHRVIRTVQPTECYHLAAQSFVSYSFEDEFSTLNTNINGTHYVLAAVHDLVPHCRFYFAGSSEMFGRVSEVPQNENTRFHPRSAYGISKVAGFELTRNYREAYGLHASSGMLYNHESPRRGFEFVTRKITSHVARIKLGLADTLPLGNLDAMRDWGHAKEYVKAMWLMLQQPTPGDYVVATGETHSVREFAELAFSRVGLEYKKFVTVDPNLFRPAEVDILQGNPALAKRVLGWDYEISFTDLVWEMTDEDLRREQATAVVAPRKEIDERRGTPLDQSGN
jgi:GDPmannose 4,6-dehydratase